MSLYNNSHLRYISIKSLEYIIKNSDLSYIDTIKEIENIVKDINLLFYSDCHVNIIVNNKTFLIKINSNPRICKKEYFFDSCPIFGYVLLEGFEVTQM